MVGGGLTMNRNPPSEETIRSSRIGPFASLTSTWLFKHKGSL